MTFREKEVAYEIYRKIVQLKIDENKSFNADNVEKHLGKIEGYQNCLDLIAEMTNKKENKR